LSQIQSQTDTVRPTEDAEADAEQQHPGTHAPLGASLDPGESRSVENGRKVSDSQHVTMPKRSRDAAE